MLYMLTNNLNKKTFFFLCLMFLQVETPPSVLTVALKRPYSLVTLQLVLLQK